MAVKAVVDRQIVLLVALGVLALSLIFFSWVLQLPYSNAPAPVQHPPAIGRVEVNVVATPTPSPSALAQPCEGLPPELKTQCEQSLENQTASPTAATQKPSSPCDGLPAELKQACLNAQKTTSNKTPVQALSPCGGLPDPLKQECLSAIGG